MNFHFENKKLLVFFGSVVIASIILFFLFQDSVEDSVGKALLPEIKYECCACEPLTGSNAQCSSYQGKCSGASPQSCSCSTTICRLNKPTYV